MFACGECVHRLEMKLRALLIRGGARPAPRQGQWVSADCWLCERIALPTLPLGVVESGGSFEAPFYACNWCIGCLEDRARCYRAHRAGLQRDLTDDETEQLAVSWSSCRTYRLGGRTSAIAQSG